MSTRPKRALKPPVVQDDGSDDGSEQLSDGIEVSEDVQPASQHQEGPGSWLPL
jgi:hypothetical protein